MVLKQTIEIQSANDLKEKIEHHNPFDCQMLEVLFEQIGSR